MIIIEILTIILTLISGINFFYSSPKLDFYYQLNKTRKEKILQENKVFVDNYYESKSRASSNFVLGI